MPEENDIRLIGKKAGLYLPSGKIFFGESGEESLKTEKLLYDSPFAGHIYLADNMRKVLKGEALPFVLPEETINVSAIIELFYKSAEEGREVFMEELMNDQSGDYRFFTYACK